MTSLEERLVWTFKWKVQVIIIWILWSILVTLKLGQRAITYPLTYIGQYIHVRHLHDFVWGGMNYSNSKLTLIKSSICWVRFMLSRWIQNYYFPAKKILLSTFYVIGTVLGFVDSKVKGSKSHFQGVSWMN